ncbi:unnamed protein product [Sphagnum tenellum]
MLKLHEVNLPVDLVTVSAEARNQGTFDRLGGNPTLTGIFDDTFSIGNAEAYARMIKAQSTLRSIVQVTTEVAKKAAQGLSNVDDFLDEIESKVFHLSQHKTKSSSAKIKDVLLANLESMEERALNQSSIIGLKTGFREFDGMTQGLTPGQLIILAARPAMGKTSLALSICHNVMKLDQKSVIAFFSLEMTKEELGFRLMACETKIPSQRLKVGNLTHEEWSTLSTASATLANSALEIIDEGDPVVFEIKSHCRRLHTQEKRLDLVVVDHLQLMRGPRSQARGESHREREVAEISQNLKKLAKELRVPIIVLSQLNRSPESRPNKRPQLSDLRESGSIEADADIVAFLYRDEVYNPETEARGQGELIVSKLRGGPIGTVQLTWVPELTLFKDPERTFLPKIVPHS